MPLDHKDDKLEKQGVTDLIEQSTLPNKYKNELKTVSMLENRGKNSSASSKNTPAILQGGNFKAST